MQEPLKSKWLDYAIPIVAILVITFSLGLIFYDPAFNLRPNRSDLLKTYAPNPSQLWMTPRADLRRDVIAVVE